MLKQWFTQWGARNEAARAALAELSLAPVDTGTRLEQTRFVVLDFETTGLNIRKDVPVSIGAIAIERHQIRLDQQFEQIIHQPAAQAGEATLIHGLSPEDIAGGVALAEALVAFYSYAQNSVLIAFHAPFDQAILNRATKQQFDCQAAHQFLDAYDIGLALYPEFDHVKGLDAWATALGLDTDIDRHHAAADALMTAELMLIFLSRAQQLGIFTLGQLLRKVEQVQRLRATRNRV